MGKEATIAASIPEEFWRGEEPYTSPFEAKRLLETEIDRLEKENKQLKETLQQVRIKRDEYREQMIHLQNSNAELVRRYSK